MEYDRRLSEVETRLKSELETLEAREESLTNELQAKDTSLEGEKRKLKETMDMLESELQCSICSELFINVSPHSSVTNFVHLIRREWVMVSNVNVSCSLSSAIHNLLTLFAAEPFVNATLKSEHFDFL